MIYFLLGEDERLIDAGVAEHMNSRLDQRRRAHSNALRLLAVIDGGHSEAEAIREPASESVAQMGSWQPQYVDLDPAQERLTETVLKLEREVYQIQRPRSLANRDVFLRIGEPIEISRFMSDYLRDARAVRHCV